jgi:tetratricopeptide (TPR) repeat protein
MAEKKPTDSIELGMLYVREERYQAAYPPLRQALVRFGEQNVQDIPLVLLSYYGLCLVALKRDVERGLGFCRRAVNEAGHRTEFYWNLGKAYLLLNKKTLAIATFRHGLEIDDDRRLSAELAKLGVRSQPLIPFLPRRHFLNRYLGRLRTRSHS